ncbi:hypothetical protein XENTR_v10013872 [Xenopus tropicalis]|uniref:Cancer-related nucleoside-triphosphatase n=1 Tax=Xenopus tropicalis TaxID=8364 RepID=A0A8J0SNE7_XENTR|nr:cancer-related nucleoside-triphosphatase [Xenopus tropicalis]KAE8602074.1 hypothetical protein XENTR_v10013872 [Xenopus tropicalis]
MSKHVFLTGPPGIGKTTLIQKTVVVLKSHGYCIHGFYTEEVRAGGRRVGFDVVTLSGKRGSLSRISAGIPKEKCKYMVGQYAVDLISFEQLALPVLTDVAKEKQKSICIIDEIGKMELFSQSFIHAVRKTLDCDTAFIFGTIPATKGKPLLLVEEIKNRADVRIFNITRENRGVIMQEIVTAIQECCK